MKSFFGWLKNSTKIKRWIFLMLIGMVLACYGFAQIIVVDRLVLEDIIKIVITFVVGITAFIVGLVFIQKRTLELAVLQDSKTVRELGDSKDKGPKVVVIGGGAGLNRILTGLKNYTNNLTAIVTVSSYGNRIKRRPTDDIRNSIIALSKDSTEMEKLMNLPVGKSCFWDLYLDAMENANQDLAKGIEKSNSVLSMVGKVLPATLDEMHICVELEDGTIIEEKEKIAEITTSKVTKINRVFIKPTNCRTTPGIVEAIKDADAIVIGPGSLYTSVIPNLLIKNVARTIRESKAYKIYISNIMTESGHTDDYALSNHIQAITDHAGAKIIDYCICDNGDIVPEILRKYNKAGASLVEIDKQNIKGVQIIKADVSNTEGEYIRHNPELIAKQIVEIIVNDMKFKDKKGDEKFILLNSKLKEAKKKSKNIRKSKHRKTKPSTRGKSKFISKYQDRIESIRESEQTTNSNKKIYEKAKKMTEDAEKKEKEKFLKTLKNTTKNKKKIEK
jgi:uncharacterized cofD-like protein